MIHQERTHPAFVDGCFACRIANVGIAPSATGSEDARSVNAREQRWDKDIPAYKRLRRNGVQPPRIDGSAVREARANTRAEIES